MVMLLINVSDLVMGTNALNSSWYSDDYDGVGVRTSCL